MMVAWRTIHIIDLLPTSVDKQVMARIYRDGQKRTAHVYRLLTYVEKLL
jgi:SNF2 family DNA or RNA helicase